MDQSITLSVAGAGIGGLSAGIAASMAGHQVHIFEQAPEFSEVGAGIQMGPNVWQCLREWHIDKATEEWAAFPQAIQARSATTHKLLAQMELGQSMLERYGAPYTTIHRADLHHVLATHLSQLPSVTINTGVKVQGFTQKHDDVVLLGEHGQELVTSQGLIAADGVWSKLRQQLLEDGQPQPTGHYAYRGLIRQTALPEKMRNNHVTVWMGHRLHAVLYPIRGGEWLNMVVIVALPGRAVKLSEEQSWNMSAPVEYLENATQNTCQPLRNMILAISAHGTSHQGAPWRMWPLFGRPAVRNAKEMAEGRIALLGDAAHPMLPYLAQGAAMAIEDAWQLQQSLQRKETDLPSQLQHYAKARYQRNARVQAKSARNGRIFHLSGLMRTGRDLSLGMLGERLMDTPWLYRSIVPRSAHAR